MAEKRKRSDPPSDGVRSKKSKADKKAPGGSKKKQEEPAALPDGVQEEAEEFIALDEGSEAPSKKDSKGSNKNSGSKKDKKDSKSPKKSKTETNEETGASKSATPKKSKANASAPETTQEETGNDEQPAALSKNQQKKARKAAAAAAAAESAAADGDDKQLEGAQKALRHIVFVGNLPFTANASTIRQHFATLKPSAVRCLSKDGVEDTCRGFAFVEFANSTHMRTCLDKMHHSTFNDGLSPARKINVELTAGGGGAKSNRKEKIKARNEKLAANRAKRIQKEDEDKKANATGQDTAASSDGVHPSRRAMMS